MSERKNAPDRSTALPVDSGLQDSAYPKPVVVQAISGTLSPMGALPDGIEVLVTYPSMTTSDVITLMFDGDDTFVPQKGDDEHTVSFHVNPSHVGAALGKTVDVTYTVNRQGTVVSSEVLKLNVLPLMEGDMNMVAITQATASTPGTLNLSKFSGDAELKITPWPFIAKDQPVWMDMISESSTQRLLNAHPVTSEEVTSGITHLISRPVLETIPDGSLLTFSGKVQTDGSGSATGAQEFQVLKLLLRHGDGETGDVVEDFEGHSSGEKKSPFETTYMTFIGRGQSLIQEQDAQKMRHNTALDSETLQITLKETYSKVVVDTYCNANHSAKMVCEYEGGEHEQLIGDGTITAYTFEHPGIRGFKIHGSDQDCVLQLDNFKLSK